MSTLDWHIKCESDKKCIVYRDDKEEFPAMELNMMSKEHEWGVDESIEIKSIPKFHKISAGTLSKQVASEKISVRLRRK